VTVRCQKLVKFANSEMIAGFGSKRRQCSTTGKARSPILLYFDRGTIGPAVNADYSRCLQSMSDARCSSLERYDGAKLCWHRKPRAAAG